MAPSMRSGAWVVAVAWGGRGRPARREPPALAKPSRLSMVAHHSSICSAASGIFSSSWARAMASEAVLDMDDDEVDRAVMWLLTLPVAAVLRPRCYCGATTWSWCGEGARWPVALSVAAAWSTRPEGGARTVAAPVVGAAGGRRFAPVRAPLLRMCPSVGERGEDGVTPSPVPWGAWPSGCC